MKKTYLKWVAGAAFSTMALPALAQDCGGLGVGGVWIGGDEASSDISTAADYQEQLALVLLGNNYVSRFSLSAPTDVRLEAEGRGSGDPVIELFDDAGVPIGYDDDGGGNAASRLETSLMPGNYCLAMSSYDSSPMTGTVRIGRQEHAALTAGLSGGGGGYDTGTGCSSAVPLVEGILNEAVESGQVTATNSINSTPAYSFTLSEPTMLTLTAVNPNADPVLTLYDGFDGWLAENDDYDGLNSRIDMTSPLAPGDYCISLRALSNGDLPVTVGVTVFDAEEAMRMRFDRGEMAPPLDGSYPVENLGVVSTRTRHDVQMQAGKASWVSFDVQDSGLMLIEVIGASGGDPVITIYDDLGREIGYDDDGGEGLDSLLAQRIQPGTYLMAINDLHDSSGLMRVVLERYVPAR